MKYIYLFLIVIFLSPPIFAEKIRLEWDLVDDVDGYQIFKSVRSQLDDGTWENTYDYDNPIKTELYPDGKVPQNTNFIDIDLPGEPDKEIRYMFVARSYVGIETSDNSNEVEYKVNRIVPPAPIDLTGSYSKTDSIVNLSWQQPIEQWYSVHHWTVFYKIEGEWIELGTVSKDNELILTKEFSAVSEDEQAQVQFTVISYRRSGTFSNDSDILTLTIDRRDVPPIQNLRINIEIPVI